jgi:hypothetical protein
MRLDDRIVHLAAREDFRERMAHEFACAQRALGGLRRAVAILMARHEWVFWFVMAGLFVPAIRVHAC